MKTGIRVAVAVLIVLVGGVVAALVVKRQLDHGYETREHERVTPATPSDLLEDDKLEDKTPAFDAARVDSRPFGPRDNPWQLNLSAAVLKLDIPDLREDRDGELRTLHTSFAAAAVALQGRSVLPSVNLVSAKAKQFDDGLYAALDLHWCDNREAGLQSVHLLVRQLMTRCDPRTPAHAWLWGALEVGGFISPDEATRRPAAASQFVSAFRARSHESQVVGFYEWSEELGRAFTFLRYLQQDIADRRDVADALARALNDDPGCMDLYRRMTAFYARLTNPLEGLSLVDIVDNDSPVNEIGQAREAAATLRFLPWSASKENSLFLRLFPNGLDRDADLMREFVAAIRDGRVNLAPTDSSGWYDHQIYSLESFVLPQAGLESERLLLTRKYKLRLIEAFKAMVTRYRETHVRQASVGQAASAPPSELRPRLRVEPNPTYFLRVARSYAFLQSFLSDAVADLNALHGAREGGWRDMPLGDELEHMRLLFCGLHLVSCEDIGQKPALLTGEVESEDHTRALAAAWLDDWQNDPDFKVDTRVAVPVLYNGVARTRFWASIGVRAVPLHASWARAPSWRRMPSDGNPVDEWKEIEGWRCEPLECVILVDEFAEFAWPGMRALSRSELRKICDGAPDKENLLARLRR